MSRGYEMLDKGGDPLCLSTNDLILVCPPGIEMEASKGGHFVHDANDEDGDHGNEGRDEGGAILPPFLLGEDSNIVGELGHAALFQGIKGPGRKGMGQHSCENKGEEGCDGMERVG